MRKIKKKDVGKKLAILLDEQHPIDEDIGILDADESVIGVVINKKAYDFFLKKLEEEEDRIDNETVEKFHLSGENSQ